MSNRLDVIYVTASARDARFTRICVASIRYFYPHAPIKLLIGGSLEDGLARELARYWDVGTSDLPRGDWGWGFVKLEPLFGRSGDRFMIVDSDTVFCGPVLSTWTASDADFLVDEEEQTEAEIQRIYYDWRHTVTIDGPGPRPRFVFNTGQWFGTAGVLSRTDFATVMDWSVMPPKARFPDCFRNGDQGVLNYVLNHNTSLGRIRVDRSKIMHWPGFGMQGFTTRRLIDNHAPPRVIHWAGYKSARLGQLPGADILRFFERLYYERLPAGIGRRTLARVRYPLEFWRQELALRMRIRMGTA